MNRGQNLDPQKAMPKHHAQQGKIGQGLSATAERCGDQAALAVVAVNDHHGRFIRRNHLEGVALLQLLEADVPRRLVFFRLLGVGLLVAGLAAVQLLPFLDLLRASQRSPRLVTDEWAMPLTGWANFLVPLFRTSPNGVGVHFQDTQQITSSYYLGISMAALALIAVWRARDRRVWLFAVITGACLVLALGRAGGAYTLLLNAFPPLALVRFPVKFVMLPVPISGRRPRPNDGSPAPAWRWASCSFWRSAR